ncbi:MAG: hypothetical protein ABH952_07850 [Candidatus Omnitrophota bacterium]
MGDELKRLYVDAYYLKNIILQNRNIDILLYLAKYNPEVKITDIIKNFGKESLEGLKALEGCNLVREEDGQLTLTNEGIFQVDGLLSIAA